MQRMNVQQSRTARGYESKRIGRARQARSELWDSESIGRLAVTVEEGAHMLGVGRATLYKLIMRGEIASFTVGRARRIAVATLEQYAGVRRSA